LVWGTSGRSEPAAGRCRRPARRVGRPSPPPRRPDHRPRNQQRRTRRIHVPRIMRNELVGPDDVPGGGTEREQALGVQVVAGRSLGSNDGGRVADRDIEPSRARVVRRRAPHRSRLRAPAPGSSAPSRLAHGRGRGPSGTPRRSCRTSDPTNRLPRATEWCTGARPESRPDPRYALTFRARRTRARRYRRSPGCPTTSGAMVRL
jgi:hypothetical protein